MDVDSRYQKAIHRDETQMQSNGATKREHFILQISKSEIMNNESASLRQNNIVFSSRMTL